MILVNGKKIAEEKLSKLKKKIEEEGFSLSLAVLKVGENPVADVYINAKEKLLRRYGIEVSVRKFEEDFPEDKLIESIKKTEEDGVIIQLPLPEKINKSKIFKAIPRRKDVDVFSDVACGEYYKGGSILTPPVVRAVEIILEESAINIKGKKIALVGAGDLVGKPLSVFFTRKMGTVFLLNEYTENIKNYTLISDIVVSGTGVPGIIKGEMIKEGVVLIDAGTSVEEGKIKGDIEKESVKEKSGLFSPAIGGIGPLTTYALAENLFNLKKYG